MAKQKYDFLVMRSTVRTLSVKCYDEQIPQGWNEMRNRISKIDKSKIQILAICHDRDTNHDSIWEPSVEKAHYHIIVRVVERDKNNKAKNMHVSQILEKIGVVYRQPEDENLWKNSGVETVKDFSNFAMYLTHDTEQSILDGKANYSIEEIVSNLDLEEIKQIREGYVRPSEENRKVSNSEMRILDGIAAEKGYALESFEDWKQSLDFSIRNSSKMKTVEKTYWYHTNRRIEESKNMLRLCIYIQGEPNIGKTCNSKIALQKMGYKIFSVDSKGNNTGKFDNLRAEHSAMIVDDVTLENVLNMADNSICQVYRRNSNNPFWAGEILVVTSNKDFDDWAKASGVEEEEIGAARSRFYLCHVKVENDRVSLICDSPSTRGTTENQQARFEIYKRFRDLLNEGMAEYMKMKQENTSENIYKGLNINCTVPTRKLKLNGKAILTKTSKVSIPASDERVVKILAKRRKEEVREITGAEYQKYREDFKARYGYYPEEETELNFN